MFSRVFAVSLAMVAASGHVMAGGLTPTFSVQTVSVGGPSGLGSPFNVVGGTIFQDPNGSDFPPDPGLFDNFPSLQFDSYVAIDPFGPAAPGASSAAPDGTNALDFTSTGLSGGWFSDGGVVAEVGPFPGFFAVFIARVSVTEGATLEAPSIGAIVESEFGTEEVEQELDQGSSEQPPNRGGGAAYDFRSTTSTVSFPNPFGGSLFGGSRGAPSELTVEVIDIYLVRIPTPGAATLLALATGIMVMPRRRR